MYIKHYNINYTIHIHECVAISRWLLQEQNIDIPIANL